MKSRIKLTRIWNEQRETFKEYRRRMRIRKNNLRGRGKQRDEEEKEDKQEVQEENKTMIRRTKKQKE